MTTPGGTPFAKGRAVPRDFVRTTLKRRHRLVVRGMADAMFAHDGGPSPARLDAFVRDVNGFVSFGSRTLRFGLMLMLELVRFAPVLLLWRFATFERLERPDRVLVLERMERSRLTILTVAFAAYKAILCLIFFELAEELEDVGYKSARRRWTRVLPVLGSDAAE